jgi:hypothetical protein
LEIIKDPTGWFTRERERERESKPRANQRRVETRRYNLAYLRHAETSEKIQR